MNREVSVDESIISYKGRLSFLQYMPKKPNKWGMKAWVLAESDTGYTWNFILYTGKQEKRPAGVPLGTHVVTELLKKLHGKGYHVYFDNFYTSPTYASCCSPLGLAAVVHCGLTGRMCRNHSRKLMLRWVKLFTTRMENSWA